MITLRIMHVQLCVFKIIMIEGVLVSKVLFEILITNKTKQKLNVEQSLSERQSPCQARIKVSGQKLVAVILLFGRNDLGF